MREDKVAAKNAKIGELAQLIEDARQHAGEESDADRAMTLSNCRLPDNDMLELERTIQEWPETEREVVAVCILNNPKFNKLPAHVAETLASFDVQEVITTSLQFWWLSLVCQNWDFLRSFCFLIHSRDVQQLL